MKTRIKDWLRRGSERRGNTRKSSPGDYFTVLLDPEGRLLVCEDGVWKVFELDEAGRMRAGYRAGLGYVGRLGAP